MNKFLVLALSWYVQDLIQVFMTQTWLAPEIYVVALIWCATQRGEENSLRWTAAAVAGGLLMDMRWIGVPGFCGALYTAALFAARWLWFQIPAANRRMLPFAVITGGLCMALTPLRLFFWDSGVVAGRRLAVAGLQWLLTAAALILFALTRSYGYDDEDL
ncbi:MAG: hypothetical protein ACOYD9_01720 [Pyramidobacter sp.]|jgi:hypothetical protein